MSKHSEILEDYINLLKNKLSSRDPQEMNKTVEEIRTHLLDQAEDLSGNSPVLDVHIQAAIDEFGDLDEIVNDFNSLRLENNQDLDESGIDMSIVSQSFLDVKQTIQNLVRNKQKKQIFQALEWILRANLDMTKEERFALIGEVFWANPEYFMDKLYKTYQKILQNTYQVNLYELERYLLEKYTLLPGEVIQTTFQGKLQLNIHVLIGRFYLTSKRMIFHGEIKETVAILMLTRGMAKALSLATEEVKSLQTPMGAKFSEKPCFGFQYSLENGHNIRVHDNRVSFKTTYDFQKKGSLRKRKEVKVKLTIEEPDFISTIQFLSQTLQKS